MRPPDCQTACEICGADCVGVHCEACARLLSESEALAQQTGSHETKQQWREAELPRHIAQLRASLPSELFTQPASIAVSTAPLANTFLTAVIDASTSTIAINTAAPERAPTPEDSLRCFAAAAIMLNVSAISPASIDRLFDALFAQLVDIQTHNDFIFFYNAYIARLFDMGAYKKAVCVFKKFIGLSEQFFTFTSENQLTCNFHGLNYQSSFIAIVLILINQATTQTDKKGFIFIVGQHGFDKVKLGVLDALEMLGQKAQRDPKNLGRLGLTKNQVNAICFSINQFLATYQSDLNNAVSRDSVTVLVRAAERQREWNGFSQSSDFQDICMSFTMNHKRIAFNNAGAEIRELLNNGLSFFQHLNGTAEELQDKELNERIGLIQNDELFQFGEIVSRAKITKAYLLARKKLITLFSIGILVDEEKANFFAEEQWSRKTIIMLQAIDLFKSCELENRRMYCREERDIRGQLALVYCTSQKNFQKDNIDEPTSDVSLTPVEPGKNLQPHAGSRLQASVRKSLYFAFFMNGLLMGLDNRDMLGSYRKNLLIVVNLYVALSFIYFSYKHNMNEKKPKEENQYTFLLAPQKKCQANCQCACHGNSCHHGKARK